MPALIRSGDGLALPPAVTETQAQAELAALAAQNRPTRSMIGLGYYGTHTPAVILRNVLENPAWYTAYTPYQAEISQGRLEALLNFQTMVRRPHRPARRQRQPARRSHRRRRSDDPGQARRQERRSQRSSPRRTATRRPSRPADPRRTAGHRRRRRRRSPTPPTSRPASSASSCNTRRPTGPSSTTAPLAEAAHAATARSWPSPPTSSPSPLLTAAGRIRRRHRHRLRPALRRAHGLRRTPRRVHVATARRVQAPNCPAASSASPRQRRQAARCASPCKPANNTSAAKKPPATSAPPRCSWPSWPACTPSITAPEACDAIAEHACHRRPHASPRRLQNAGIEVADDDFFDTVTASRPRPRRHHHARAAAAGVNLRRIDADTVGVACDETTTRSRPADRVRRLRRAALLAAVLGTAIPTAHCGAKRTYLTHPVSPPTTPRPRCCATSSASPTWTLGLDRTHDPPRLLHHETQRRRRDVSRLLARIRRRSTPSPPPTRPSATQRCSTSSKTGSPKITGFAAVSVQPNAGSQGEYAGLLAIRAYHEAAGKGTATSALSHVSAHGTNPACAVIAGLDSRRRGLRRCRATSTSPTSQAKIATHADRLGRLHGHLSSTHGVFEEDDHGSLRASSTTRAGRSTWTART